MRRGKSGKGASFHDKGQPFPAKEIMNYGYKLKKRKQLHGRRFKYFYEREKTRSFDNLFIFREFEKRLKETPLWFLFRK